MINPIRPVNVDVENQISYLMDVINELVDECNSLRQDLESLERKVMYPNGDPMDE